MSHFQLSSRNRKSCKSKITVLTVNIYFSINKSCHSNIFNMNSKDFSSGNSFLEKSDACLKNFDEWFLILLEPLKTSLMLQREHSDWIHNV